MKKVSYPYSILLQSTDTQQSIPEGMIPKEVVARNRNRQAGILTVKEKSPVKTSNTKSLGSKSESFEDE